MHTLAQAMPRACHPQQLVIYTPFNEDGGQTAAFVYGACPKCGTGTDELEVPTGSITTITRLGGGSQLIIEKCTISVVCPLETCQHAYAVHI